MMPLQMENTKCAQNDTLNGDMQLLSQPKCESSLVSTQHLSKFVLFLFTEGKSNNQVLTSTPNSDQQKLMCGLKVM